MSLRNLDNGYILATEVGQAHSFFKRLKGLMFTKSLKSGRALHIQPCRSIHTFFMNYPIDVLYLSDTYEIVAIDKQLQPGQVGKNYRRVNSVIELPAGTIDQSNTRIGQKVSLKNTKKGE